MAASPDYIELLAQLQELTGKSVEEMNSFHQVLVSQGLDTPEELNKWINQVESYQSQTPGQILTKDGKVAFQYTETASNYTSPLNSNTATKTVSKAPLTSTALTPTKLTTLKSGMREAGTFVLGTAAPAVCAAGIGISLGKTIDSALYNAAPDFWDEHGMSSINPETWASLTSDDNTGLGSLFNLVFGIDPATGETQAYIDEDAYAYLAYWMAQQGVFNAGGDVEYGTVTLGETLNIAEETVTGTLEILRNQYAPLYPFESQYYWDKRKGYNAVLMGGVQGSPLKVSFLCGNGMVFPSGNVTVTSDPNSDGIASVSPTIPLTVGSDARILSLNSQGQLSFGSVNFNGGEVTTKYDKYRLLVKSKLSSAIDGIGDQSGATQPDTSTWTDPTSTKTSLQQQYPNTFGNAKHYDYVDSDGTQNTRTYIPINLPMADSPTDPQPTSGDESQSKPVVDPTTNDLIQQLIRPMVTPVTETPAPPDTGTGDTPTVVPVTGNASSLWAIYNPSQAEIDSFGAWLWSSNLVDQIKKLFSDPMQAIIGVHKVFATPSTGAAQTIKVGYLDSGVSAAVVTDQYTTVDCGTVNLREYFGNVLDYSPYTEVSLYLPFIGIVKLDPADVMRASVSVKYHVDVLTGACLADVNVARDASGGVLYQYAGSAIVTYPVSSGSYVGAVAGVLGIAGGIAGTVLSGGALAPAFLGGAMGASHLHADIQHSGGFSGAPGAMGAKKPYIIISRAQGATPDLKEIKGTPATRRVTLGSCSGYTVVDQVNLDGIPATSGELTEIESLLKQGVIV